MAKDEETIEQQKLEWIAMEERITGLVEIVNVSNVQFVADQILKENLILGRGLFCRAVMKSQLEFPELSNVYASLAAIINSEFPEVGFLLAKRVVVQFREAFDCKDKKKLQKTSTLVAQLVNRRVVYEVLALNVLMFLLVNPSSDNVEVAVGFCRQCGSLLMEVAPHKLKEILKEFNRVFWKGALEEHVELSIMKLSAAERAKFKVVDDGLDFVKVEDEVTHDVSLLQDVDPEISVDSFNPDLSV